MLNIIGNFWVIDLFACHKLGGDKNANANSLAVAKSKTSQAVPWESL